MNKQAWITTAVIIVVVIIGIVVYAGSTKAPVASSNNLTDTTSTGATSTVKSFTVSGKNFSFSPSTMSVKKGDTVKIIFKNTSGFHDLRIDEFNVATKQIEAGKEDTVQFVADKTGTFEYYCSVGNHRAMGMKGTLTVQ